MTDDPFSSSKPLPKLRAGCSSHPGAPQNQLLEALPVSFGEKRLRGGRVWFRPGGLDCLGEALTVVPVCTWREMAVHGDLVTGSARAAATRRRWAPRSVSEA